MNFGENPVSVQKAIAAVRDCADSLEARAVSLQRALPPLPMDEGLRASAMELCSALKDASGRVTFELGLLQKELVDRNADAGMLAPRLSSLDVTMTRAVAAAAELADSLESAAERDEANEPAFELVIDAVGVMLQDLARAEAETHKLRTGTAEDRQWTAVRW